jgi:hypothetical protein
MYSNIALMADKEHKDRDEKGRFVEGNLVALGMKSNGGRKSAYEELGRAILLEQAFFNEIDEDEAKAILKKVEDLRAYARTGKDMRGKKSKVKMSLFKVSIAKALAGNEKLLMKFISKVFPDKILDETPQGKSPAAQILEAILEPKKKPTKKKTVNKSKK